MNEESSFIDCNCLCAEYYLHFHFISINEFPQFIALHPLRIIPNPGFSLRIVPILFELDSIVILTNHVLSYIDT